MVKFLKENTSHIEPQSEQPVDPSIPYGPFNALPVIIRGKTHYIQRKCRPVPDSPYAPSAPQPSSSSLNASVQSDDSQDPNVFIAEMNLLSERREYTVQRQPIRRRGRGPMIAQKIARKSAPVTTGLKRTLKPVHSVDSSDSDDPNAFIVEMNLQLEKRLQQASHVQPVHTTLAELPLEIEAQPVAHTTLVAQLPLGVVQSQGNSRFRPKFSNSDYQVIHFRGAIDLMRPYYNLQQCLASRVQRISSFQGNGYSQSMISALTETGYAQNTNKRTRNSMQFLRFVDSVRFDTLINPYALVIHCNKLTPPPFKFQADSSIWEQLSPPTLTRTLLVAQILKFVDCAWWSVEFGKLMNNQSQRPLSEFVDKFNRATNFETLRLKLVHRNLMTFIQASDCFQFDKIEKNPHRLAEFTRQVQYLQGLQVTMEYIFERISKRVKPREFQEKFLTKTIPQIVKQVEAKHL